MNDQLQPVIRNKSAERWSPEVSKPSRRGAAVIEFAMVAPLIFLFLFAGVEFGRVQMVHHGLEAAAREGCRKAITWNAVQQDVKTIVSERLGTFGISGYTLTIEPDPPKNACQWEPITVRIEVTYDQVSWLPAPRYLQGVTFVGTCTLPQESDQCGS